MDTLVFDLDGTLLPMDFDKFVEVYNYELGKAFSHLEDPKEMVQKLWASTKHTITSRENKNNFDKFFDDFSNRVEGNVKEYKDLFDRFYDNGFMEARNSTYISGEIVEAIKILKDKGYRLIIATNPMLPMKANHRRIEWAGLNKDDFEYISSLEKNMHCKPSLEFYREVIKETGINPEKAFMIGNDVQEDLVASELGFKTYLITDCIIHRGGEYSVDHSGTYKDFLTFVKNLPNLS